MWHRVRHSGTILLSAWAKSRRRDVTRRRRGWRSCRALNSSETKLAKRVDRHAACARKDPILCSASATWRASASSVARCSAHAPCAQLRMASAAACRTRSHAKRGAGALKTASPHTAALAIGCAPAAALPNLRRAATAPPSSRPHGSLTVAHNSAYRSQPGKIPSTKPAPLCRD
jgi:hypothetical protein